MEKRRSCPAVAESKTLQDQSRKMEEKLLALKEMMAKEKAKRERIHGTRWKSSKRDSVPADDTKGQSRVAKQKKSKAPKIRILTESNIMEQVLTSPSGSKKDGSSGLSKEGHPEGVRSVPTPSTSVDSYCGQCEEQRAVLFCRECQERYCQECFTSHHRKGALARHHPVLLSKPTITANCNREDHSNPRAGSLLNGRFSEEDSAASFQEALLAWRRGEDPPGGQLGPEPSKKIEKKVTPVSTTANGSVGTAVSTNTSRSVESAIPPAPSSLSYMEKLLVHKHRTDPFFYRRGKNAHSSDFGVDIGEEHDSDSLSNQPSEYNIFYRPDHEQCTEQISVDKTALRAPSRVEIEEIGTELGCRPGQDGKVSAGEVNDGKVSDGEVNDGKVSDGKLPQAVVEDVSGRSNNSYDKSIKQAWSDSRRLQKESLELCSFFLAGTNGGDESREHPITLPLFTTLAQTVTLSSATSVWCPELSTAVDADTPPEEHIQLPTSVGGDSFAEENDDDRNLEYIRPESVLATALEMEQVTAKKENDIADSDTLDRLAWELESITGRGTPLSDHISEDSLDEDDDITANIPSISMDHPPHSDASKDTTMLLQDQLSSLFNQDY